MENQTIVAPQCAAKHELIVGANSNEGAFKILWEYDNASILQKKNGFTIEVISYDERAGQKLENALLYISTLEKKAWTGTIQDFQAIFQLLNKLHTNALYLSHTHAQNELARILSKYTVDPRESFFDSIK